MNMRQRKLAIMTAMYYIASNAAWDRWINKVLKPSEAEQLNQKIQNRAHFEEMLSLLDTSGRVAAQKALFDKVYKVARVKDNVVVFESQVLAEAQEAIEKAARQKKAKLYLLDDEPYVFPADEPLDQYDPNNFVHLT